MKCCLVRRKFLPWPSLSPFLKTPKPRGFEVLCPCLLPSSCSGTSEPRGSEVLCLSRFLSYSRTPEPQGSEVRLLSLAFLSFSPELQNPEVPKYLVPFPFPSPELQNPKVPKFLAFLSFASSPKLLLCLELQNLEVPKFPFSLLLLFLSFAKLRNPEVQKFPWAVLWNPEVLKIPSLPFPEPRNPKVLAFPPPPSSFFSPELRNPEVPKFLPLLLSLSSSSETPEPRGYEVLPMSSSLWQSKLPKSLGFLPLGDTSGWRDRHSRLLMLHSFGDLCTFFVEPQGCI